MRHIVFNPASSRPETIQQTAIKRFLAAVLICFFLVAQAWGQSLSVSKGKILLGSNGQDSELTDTVTVTATGAWTVTMTVNWLTLDKVASDAAGDYTMTASGGRNITLSGSGNGRFTVRVLSNSGGQEREGALTVAAGATTRTITVKQDWGTIEVGGIKYSRINPNKPLDPYVAVVYKGAYPDGGYWTDPVLVETSPGQYVMEGDIQWIPDPDQYGGDIVIPDTMEYQERKYIPERISDGAFNKCYSLTSIAFPNSLKSIGEKAFWECKNLTSITLPNSLKSIGKNAFWECKNLTSVKFPNSLESIEGYAFQDCIKLTSITVPNSVTKIGYSAFQGCSSLTSAILPGSITILQSSAFLSCSSLRTIEVGWNTPINAVWYSGTIAEISLFHAGAAYGTINFNYANCKLIVPPGTKGLYQGASVWKKFGNIVEATLSTVSDTLSFESGAANTTTVVESNILAWTVAKKPADADWLTLTGASGSGNGAFTLAIASNNSAPREAKIIVASTSTAKVADTIVVTQAINPEFNISTEALYFGYDDATAKPIDVTAYTAWTAAKDSTWIILNPTNPADNKPGHFTVAVTANPGMARRGNITVTNGTETDTIYVIQAANQEFNVSTTPLTFAHNDATPQRIDVTAHTAWTAAKDSTWIILNPTNPADNKPGYFTIAVTANSGVVRKGKVTVTHETETDTIYVTQAANPAFNVPTEPLTFAHNDATPQRINVTAYTTWTAANDSAWIILNPTNPSGNKPGHFTIAVSTNPGVGRKGKVTVTNGTEMDTIYVTQAANPALNVPTRQLTFAHNDATPQEITVTAYTAWTAAKDSTWIILNPTTPSGNKPGSFTVAVTASTGMERKGKVTVTNGAKTDTIYVTQVANPTFNVPTTPLTFAYNDATSRQITVTAYTAWTVAKDSAWIFLAPTHPSGNKPGSFTVAVRGNTGVERKGKVTVTNGTKTDTIYVTQAANPAFNVPTTPLTFAYNGATPQRINVTAYTAWTAAKDSVWIILNPTHPSGSKPGSFTVAVTANTGVERKGKVTVTNGTETDTIYVSQAANPALALSADSLFFGADETGDTTITVTSNMAWAVEKDSTWIILNPANPSGNKPGSFTVAVTANPGVERIGKITATNGTTIDSIVVTQAGNPKIVLSTDSIIFGTDEELEATVTVTAYVDWTVTLYKGATWLSVDPASGTGKESFTVTATPCEDEEIRTALIVVASASHSDTIHVTQFAFIDNNPSFEENGIHYYITDAGSREVKVIAPETDAYTGKVIIPSTVTHSRKTYNVTTIGAEAFADSDVSYLGLPFSLKSVGTDAFKGCLSLDSVEIKWKSPADAYPEGIHYAFGGVEVSEVTLMVPEGTKAIYQVARFWGLFNIEESPRPVGISKATEVVTVHAASGRLYVDSPAAETVYVYSFTGKLLYTATKATGQATFDVPAEKFLIVRGSSGWARKLMVNR
jgi:hypothetical protein